MTSPTVFCHFTFPIASLKIFSLSCYVEFFFDSDKVIRKLQIHALQRNVKSNVVVELWSPNSGIIFYSTYLYIAQSKFVFYSYSLPYRLKPFIRMVFGQLFFSSFSFSLELQNRTEPKLITHSCGLVLS